MELTKTPGRVYGLNDEGHLVAEITFPETSPGVYCMNHTFVDPSLRGQGMADKLVRAAIEVIRDCGGMATATCSYAAGWLEKHPGEA